MKKIVRKAEGPPAGTKMTGDKPFEPYERVKVRFSYDFDSNIGSNDEQKINTKVFVGEDNTVPENISSVSDIEKVFRWNCTAQFAIMSNKYWIQKTGDKKSSFGFKCLQICITELSTSMTNSVTQTFSQSVFVKSTPYTKVIKEAIKEATKEAAKVTTKEITKEATKDATKEATDDSDDDEEDDEEDEDSDDSEKKQSPKKPSPKKAPAKKAGKTK